MPSHKTVGDTTKISFGQQVDTATRPTWHEDPMDFRQLYSFSKVNPSGSSRSLSSCTTNWSTSTDPTSNTTQAKREQKHQKKRFRSFAKLLMRFLERKDPRVFDEAQAVIRDCEQRKIRGEVGYESVTDSLKAPLREVVGNTYWREARRHEKRGNQRRRPCDPLEPLLQTENIPTLSQAEAYLLESHLRTCPDISQTQPCHQSSGDDDVSCWLSTRIPRGRIEETEIRRERFIMLLRIIIRYLSETDEALFRNTERAIKKCLSEFDYRKGTFEGCVQSIQSTVKTLVGVSLWRRAESLLGRIIRKQVDDETLDAILDEESDFELDVTETRIDPISDPLFDNVMGDYEDQIQLSTPIPPTDLYNASTSSSSNLNAPLSKRILIQGECSQQETAQVGDTPPISKLCPVEHLTPMSLGLTRKRRKLLASQ